MASTTFRDSMNSLGWSRRDPDIPVSTSSNKTPILSRLQSLNPFGDGGYVRLPTQEEGPGAPLPAPSRREEEEGFFA
ncbi:protein transport protein sft2, partial [Xylographa trunciseda]|nr:protein transport protein sft2 [Xylographa trunciseda]